MHFVHTLGRYTVSFRQDGNARVDAEQLHNAEMLNGLGHDAIIGGNH